MALFNDEPVGRAKKGKIDDMLNTEIYAEAIAGFISDCDTPVTIGIQGDWGSGKSSLMNMISSHLTPKTKYKEITLNTWHYSLFNQDEYLGLAVISALITKVQSLFEVTKDNKIIDTTVKNVRKLVNLLSKVQINVPVLPIGIGVSDAIDSLKDKDGKQLEFENISSLLEEFKEEFKKLTTHLPVDQRLVFYIDDLDRVKPIKAVEVLEALKLFMDIEKCVFILAIDYDVVQLGITEKFGQDIQKSIGKSFFDKIIQLPFNMPTSSISIDDYVADLLEKSKLWAYNFDNKEKKYFVDITEVTVGRNPRSIKRAVNYATLLDRLRRKVATKEDQKSKTTTQLLYSIVCMQIAWPELFEYFVLNPTPETIKNLEDWDFLHKLPQAKKMFARVKNVEEVQDNISGFFDTLYEILDREDNDGMINESELKELIDVMILVRLLSDTNLRRSENSLKSFREKLIKNCESRSNDMLKFYNDVFSHSQWATSSRVTFKKAGERYHSIVYDRRKQIGSISTLKTRPFLMRLKVSRFELLEAFKQHPDFETYKSVIKDVDNPKTGIGNSEIDVSFVVNNPDLSKEILDNLFNKFVTMLDKPERA